MKLLDNGNSGGQPVRSVFRLFPAHQQRLFSMFSVFSLTTCLSIANDEVSIELTADTCAPIARSLRTMVQKPANKPCFAEHIAFPLGALVGENK